MTDSQRISSQDSSDHSLTRGRGEVECHCGQTWADDAPFSPAAHWMSVLIQAAVRAARPHVEVPADLETVLLDRVLEAAAGPADDYHAFFEVRGGQIAVASLTEQAVDTEVFLLSLLNAWQAAGRTQGQDAALRGVTLDYLPFGSDGDGTERFVTTSRVEVRRSGGRWTLSWPRMRDQESDALVSEMLVAATLRDILDRAGW